MQDLILTLHIIVCVILVILVLLQSGKEGMGVIFGGGNSSVFGSAGAGGILARLTTLMAVIFVITSLSYTYVTSSRPSSKSTILDVKIEDMPPARAPETAAPASEAIPQPESKKPDADAPLPAGTAAPEAVPQTPAEPAKTVKPEQPPAAPDAKQAPAAAGLATQPDGKGSKNAEKNKQ